MTVVLGAHLRQQSNLEILLRQSKALAKSENTVVKTYGKDFGHRATTEFPSLRLYHLCPIYNNDVPSTSNSYVRSPTLPGKENSDGPAAFRPNRRSGHGSGTSPDV